MVNYFLEMVLHVLKYSNVVMQQTQLGRPTLYRENMLLESQKKLRSVPSASIMFGMATAGKHIYFECSPPWHTILP